MAKFSYRAKRGINEVVKGTIEAESQDAVFNELKSQGLAPISIVKLEDKKAQKVQAQGELAKLRISAKEYNAFLQQLSSLLTARVGLLQSIGILYEQSENPKLKSVLYDLYNRIKEGSTFSEAMLPFPLIFNTLARAIVRSGEASGKLDYALRQLSIFAEKQEELKMRVYTALAYPSLMMFVGIGTIGVITTFVLPKLMNVFRDLDTEIPFSTRMVMTISDFMSKAWYIPVLLIVGVAAFFKFRKLSKIERVFFDKLKLSIPFVGVLIKNQAIVRFTRTFSLLLASNIAMFKALDLSIPVLDNEVLVKEMSGVSRQVVEGGSLSATIKKVSFFPKYVTNMITVGQEGGRLSETLEEVAVVYERNVDAAIKVVSSLLEPLIILILGLIIGLLVWAMLLPIFQISLGVG